MLEHFEESIAAARRVFAEVCELLRLIISFVWGRLSSGGRSLCPRRAASRWTGGAALQENGSVHVKWDVSI